MDRETVGSRTNRRYVMIENAGRDEVVVEEDKLREMDALGPRQKQWETLKAILGHEMTMAYLASPDARQPRLSFHTAIARRRGDGEGQHRPGRNHAGASTPTGPIAGNWPCGSTTPPSSFWKSGCPRAAELWTARVAGEPVKPTAVPGSTDPRGRADSADQDRPRRIVLRGGAEIRRPDAGRWGPGAASLSR